MRLHQASLMDTQDVVLCSASFESSSTGLGEMVDWIWSCCNASGEQFEVAVEVLYGFRPQDGAQDTDATVAGPQLLSRALTESPEFD